MSSLFFKDIDESHSEELYTHILMYLFPDIQQAQSVAREPKNAAAAVRIVFDLLARVTERGITPTDLYYFYIGYNSGYTAAMSG